MNLNATWIGPTGPNINYTVQYRPYPSDEVFTTFSTSIHTNYAVIPNLPDGFYEVNVSMLCGDSLSLVASEVGGKPTCDLPNYVSFQIIEDVLTHQKLRINLANNSTILRIRITRSNLIFKDEEIAVTTYYDVILPKSTEVAQTYKIEIANICTGGMSSFVDMGTYTVQKMSPGFSVNYSSECICSTESAVSFTDVESSVVYENPEFLTSGIYNLSVVVPATCAQSGTLNFTGTSGTDTVFQFNQTVTPSDNQYVFTLDGLDTTHGVALGSHLDDLNLTLSC